MGATQRQARHIHHHDGFVPAAASQWVLRKGKPDIYIIMMVLVAAAIQWVRRKGKLDLYILVMIVLHYHDYSVCAVASR